MLVTTCTYVVQLVPQILHNLTDFILTFDQKLNLANKMIIPLPAVKWWPVQEGSVVMLSNEIPSCRSPCTVLRHMQQFHFISRRLNMCQLHLEYQSGSWWDATYRLILLDSFI